MKGILVLTAVALVAAGWYALACWWRPLAHCWCCHGDGRHYNEKRTRFRRCWWCKGTGQRWRMGRRVWNFFRRHAHT
jgi:hypothetical protein